MSKRPGQFTASERKRRKIQRDKRYRSQAINIGDQIDKWTEIRDDLGLTSHREVAKHLLDTYIGKTEKRGPTTSTPHPFVKGASTHLTDINVSEVSSVSETSEKMSGIEVLSEESNGFMSSIPTTSVGRRKGLKSRYRIDIADVMQSGDDAKDADDPTYDPQYDISISDSLLQNCEEAELDITEEVHNITVVSDDDDDDVDEQRGKLPAGITFIQRATLETVRTARYVVEEPCLLQLAGLVPLKSCQKKGCVQPLTITTKKCGTAVYIKWVCSDGHLAYKWCTQPKLPNGVLTGNFLFCSRVVLSGNNFAKLALFGRFMSLGVPGRTTFTRIQTHYVVPQVHHYWETTQASMLRQLKDKNVVISGDGRMDSPGWCAHYCTYTIMDQSDKKILASTIVDKRETALKSTVMEAEGFKRGMAELKAAGIKVTEVVTDAHPQISSIMSKLHVYVSIC